MAVLLGSDGLRINISLDFPQGVALEELINYVLTNKTDAEDVIAARLRKEFPSALPYTATEIEYMLGQLATVFRRLLTPARAEEMHEMEEEHGKKGYGPN